MAASRREQAGRDDGRRRHDRGGDRAARFLARVDEHLPLLADDAARRAFVDRLIAGWERRYARFVATGGACEPVAGAADPPQAADFLLTIAALAARRAALGRRATFAAR